MHNIYQSSPSTLSKNILHTPASFNQVKSKFSKKANAKGPLHTNFLISFNLLSTDHQIQILKRENAECLLISSFSIAM